jgi:NitT/TauT family transport system substrate-binding protein
MKSNYKLVGLVLIALIVGFAAGWYVKPTPTPVRQERVVFALDWIFVGQHVPFFVALDKGYYFDEGLSVEIVRGFGSSDTVKRVEAKTVTFGYGDYNSIVLSRAEGGKVKAIGAVFSKGPWTLFYRADRGISTPKDLEGKTVVGAGPGDIDIVLLPAFCKEAGVDFSKIKVVSADWGSLLPMMMAGRSDGAVEFIVHKPLVDQEAEKVGVTINYFLYADYGLRMYSNGLVAHEDTIKANPDMVRGFVQATMKGYKYTFEHPEEAVEILQKFHPEVDTAVALGEIQYMRDLIIVPEIKEHGYGWMSEEQWTYTRDKVVEIFNLKVQVPVSDLYTNDFIDPSTKP